MPEHQPGIFLSAVIEEIMGEVHVIIEGTNSTSVAKGHLWKQGSSLDTKNGSVIENAIFKCQMSHVILLSRAVIWCDSVHARSKETNEMKFQSDSSSAL